MGCSFRRRNNVRNINHLTSGIINDVIIENIIMETYCIEI
jgi:hypothetical protein